MSVYTQDDQYQAEERLDAFVNSLNSMRDGSSNPEKVSRKIRQVISEIKFIREEFPSSEYSKLSNVLFGAECADSFPELKEFL